jgi:hypothetical protein
MFLPYFALEGRYVDLGTFTVNTLDIDVTATSIHAVGIVPFGESGWELFGQLGLGVVNFDLSGPSDEDEEAVRRRHRRSLQPYIQFLAGDSDGRLCLRRQFCRSCV